MKPVREYYRVVEKFNYHDGVVVRYDVKHDDLNTLQCAENWLKTYRPVKAMDFTTTYFIEKITIYEPLQPKLL